MDEGNWAAKGDQIFKILASSNKPVLLLLDEVPILVNMMLKGGDFKITQERRSKAEEFMLWLRKNSIEHQEKLIIVLSGSIGFEPVLHQAGLSATINTFRPFELKPWDEPCAQKCLEALATEYGIDLNEEVASDMLNRLGCCIPQHVQMFFSHLHEHCIKRDRMICTIEDIAEVYERDMLGVRGHAELTHYEERLKLVIGEKLLPIAIDMLTEAAISGVLSKEAIMAFQKEYSSLCDKIDVEQRDILRILEHDGYIEQTTKGYVFISKLLRDWWEKRYRNFYIPISERGD